MTLYAITGRSIYRGQVRNRMMRKALCNDSSNSGLENPTTTTLELPIELGTLTKNTEIAQTSEPAPPTDDQSETTANADARCSYHSAQIPMPSRSNSVPGRRNSVLEKRNSITDNRNSVHDKRNSVSDKRNSLIERANSVLKRSSLYLSDNDDTELDSPPTPTDERVSKVTTTVTALPPITRVQRAPSPVPIVPLTIRHESKFNRGARTYAQVAFLLYVVMLVVWVSNLSKSNF